MILQLPPPSKHRRLSVSATHENEEVMRSPLRSKRFGVVGGMQFATVNMSTNFNTKKRGKVPPRLETLLGV